MVRKGDAVRLKPGSGLRDLLEPWADALWRVVRTYQDDDDDGLRIAIALGEPGRGYTSPLSAAECRLFLMRASDLKRHPVGTGVACCQLARVQ